MAKRKRKPFKGKLGSGERFRRCVAKMRRKGAKDPEALCAAIGRKAHGKKKFQKLAAAGRKRKRK
jgi:hypothetical protein